MTPTNPLIPDGSVIITPSDMFSELRATHDEVKNLSLKLESLTDTVGGRVSIIEKVVADHETRTPSQPFDGCSPLMVFP